MSDQLLQTTAWIDSDDGAKIFVWRWMPLSGARAIILIVHGMAEYSLRYERLARRLCEAGYGVWAADARGHGRTADLKVNNPGNGGLLGHCADKNGFFRVVSDLDIIAGVIKKEYPGLPLFMLGHSWGSFLTQAYIEDHGDRLSGCVLSGTRGPGGAKIILGAPVMALIAFLRGCRRGSRLSWSIANGPYNKPFRPNRTPFDWLSRDEAEVDAFIADPLCGMLCSSGFYRDLTAGLRDIHKPENMEKIRRDLPIYVFGGSVDPVGEMGSSPNALVDVYRSMGIKDLEYVLYPDARHEALNETNREEVAASLLDWLNRH